MEKVATRKIEIEEKSRDVYCDLCHNHLGTIVEYENGYITTPEPVPANAYYDEGICLDKKWIRISGILCEDCRKKVNNQIREAFWSIATKCRLHCKDEDFK